MVSIAADALEDEKHVGKAYNLGGLDVLTFGEVTRILYQAEGKPVKILSVPMQLAKVGLYAVDPLPSIPFGINQARALEMSNVTEDNDIDTFGLDGSDLRSLSAYL